jgi:hypothetical protein
MKFTLKHALAATILVLSFAAPVTADPLEDAKAAYQRRDYATALRLWRPLAEHGDANAQLKIGHMYAHGEGVPQDFVEGVRWYRRAAEQGHASAQDSLGFSYYRGEGVPQNYSEAAKWLRLAADQGLGNSQNKLGLMYENGEGVPQDYILAHMWFNLAMAQGDTYATNRDGVAAKMTPAQIAEAQKLAREWKPIRQPPR